MQITDNANNSYTEYMPSEKKKETAEESFADVSEKMSQDMEDNDKKIEAYFLRLKSTQGFENLDEELLRSMATSRITGEKVAVPYLMEGAAPEITYQMWLEETQYHAYQRLKSLPKDHYYQMLLKSSGGSNYVSCEGKIYTLREWANMNAVRLEDLPQGKNHGLKEAGWL